MSDYFATIKQIVLSKGSKDAKIKKMIDDLKCTRYEANHFYALVMHVEKGTKGEKSSERVARRSFTMGVEIECFGFRKSVVREALQRKGVLPIEAENNMTDSETAFRRRFVPKIKKYGLYSISLAQSVNRIIGASKFAFIDSDGNLKPFGWFIEHDGCYFSNYQFMS